MISPLAGFDPINVPKLTVISIGGFMALGLTMATRVLFVEVRYRLVLVTVLAFFANLTVVLIFAGSNFNQEFFGANGRSTGYVAYVALAALLLAAVVFSKPESAKVMSRVLIWAGVASIAYGLIQEADLDPIPWIQSYSPVVGFLGNPNFQSSFVAFSGVMAFSIMISPALNLKTRLVYLAFLVVSAFVIRTTDSQQGFLVLFGGISLVCFFWLSKSRAKILTLPALALGGIGLFFVTIGTLNKGPLASLLFKDSVTYRGDYWRAGWKMTVEHPLFGVGLDSYGDWYRRVRTIDAVLRRGPNITSNAAHNVFLDISSNGGFPLLIIYSILMILVVVSAVKVLLRTPKFDPVFSGLVAVWIGYIAQSAISLNQLGLAVWGWIISGLIIGYEINTRDSNNLVKVKSPNKPNRTRNGDISAAEFAMKTISPITTMAIFIGFLLGVIFGLPTLNTASKYKSGLETGKPAVVESIAYDWPQDAARSVKISTILIQNNLYNQALSILQQAKAKFPDSYDVWYMISVAPNSPAADVAEAKAQMKRLDPLNPDLK